jgi:hypothetical protein
MVVSAGQHFQTSGEFGLDEDWWPVVRLVSDVEIDMVHLGVAQMMMNNLGHCSPSGHHDPRPVPERVVEGEPGGRPAMNSARKGERGSRAMIDPMKSGHEELNDLRDLASRLIAGIPRSPRPGSPFAMEISSVRRADGGGGKRRAQLLERLRTEMAVATGHLTLIFGGVADCLEVAAGRNNEVNLPALSFAVRPVLELAGQIDWLLDAGISAEERVQRYLAWCLADLRDRRRMVWEYQNEDGIADIEAMIDMDEVALLDEIALAGWTATPTVRTQKGFTPATLLDEQGRPIAMPKYGALAHRVSGSETPYTMLSLSGHSQRYTMIASVVADGPPSKDGRQQTKIGGFGIDVNLAIGFAVAALALRVRRLLEWNGLPAGALPEQVRRIFERAHLAQDGPRQSS